ncbi:unnamed protein product [Rotaria sordida]|uniref:Uncharacterized protein n=1 Tax=Rotaria sordida TaxID=392033 RepID=A0A816EA16_9BILA|nr:unnamed protein product [Rotaria sordida]CAF1644063.1 unnamed protein product [Rotaria sordida]
MKPQYVRFVVSSNNNLQLNSPLQSSSNFKPVHKVLQQQNTISSIRVLNGITPSPTATLPTRLIITMNPTTINKSTINTESSIIEPLPAQNTCNTNTTTSTIKSTSSNSKPESELVCVESTQCRTKETNKKIKESQKAQLVDVENNPPLDLNATQVSQPVNDCITTSNVEETADSNFNIVNQSPNSSRNDFTLKSGTPTINNTTKKTNKL